MRFSKSEIKKNNDYERFIAKGMFNFWTTRLEYMLNKGKLSLIKSQLYN